MMPHDIQLEALVTDNDMRHVTFLVIHIQYTQYLHTHTHTHTMNEEVLQLSQIETVTGSLLV